MINVNNAECSLTLFYKVYSYIKLYACTIWGYPFYTFLFYFSWIRYWSLLWEWSLSIPSCFTFLESDIEVCFGNDPFLYLLVLLFLNQILKSALGMIPFYTFLFYFSWIRYWSLLWEWSLSIPSCFTFLESDIEVCFGNDPFLYLLFLLFLNQILKSALGMIAPDVEIQDGKGMN